MNSPQPGVSGDVEPAVMDPRPSSPKGVLERQYEETLGEIDTLQAYARSAGKVIPETARKRIGELANWERKGYALSGEHLEMALAIHGELSTLVAPATVRTLKCTDPDQAWTSWMARFWVVPLIFAITVLALLSLIVFGPAPAEAAGATMAAPEPTATTAATGAAQTPAPTARALLNTQLQYLVAAVLGAGFYSLFTAYGYIAARTFDPAYNIVYLVRFLLGVVAGTILANFGPSMGLKGFQTTLLGLIGGYSAEAVNQILIRVGETLVAAVKGSGKDDVKAREAVVRTEAREEQMRQRQQTSVELADVLRVAVDSKAPVDVVNRVKVAMDALSR